MITVAVQCHNFQHRLSWMLSSILNQLDPPDIAIDISCVAGNGSPTTDEIIELYSEHLDITKTEYPLETLQYRGLTRNGAMIRCNTEWLLFADCDMVYHPEFFRRLSDTLAGIDEKHYASMMIAGRYSNDIDKGNALIAAEDYTKPIDNPWKRADARLNKIRRGCCGAGYFQLINMDHVDHGSYYIDGSLNEDYSWLNRFAKANSDHQFRRRIGRCYKLPRWFWNSQIHINHDRDNGNGLRAPKHLDDQR